MRLQRFVAIAGLFAVVVASCTQTSVPANKGSGTTTETGAGWNGAALFSNRNDWEPAVATDPRAPYVYMLTTEYGGPRACKDCPQPIVMRRSADGGRTWDPVDFLCKCKGEQWQADPQIRTDGNGDVYAAWLTTGFDIWFARSADHGETWTKPVSVIGKLAWGDHPWLTVSPGGDVYIGFNKRDSYFVSSHDKGDTWSKPLKTNPGNDGYYFHESGVVLPDNSIATLSTVYGCCPYGAKAHKRPIVVYVIRSQDEGRTWEQIEVDRVASPPICQAKGCPKAQYGSQGSIAADEEGNLVLIYNGGHTPHGGEQIWVRTSSDGGTTWSDARAISPGGDAIAAFPALAGVGEGDFRAIWAADEDGSQKHWNIWYSRSTDGGATWSEPLDISDGAGEKYQSDKGFGFFYGDYGDIGITRDGETIAVWGESPYYDGPGTTWYNIGT